MNVLFVFFVLVFNSSPAGRLKSIVPHRHIIDESKNCHCLVLLAPRGLELRKNWNTRIMVQFSLVQDRVELGIFSVENT